MVKSFIQPANLKKLSNADVSVTKSKQPSSSHRGVLVQTSISALFNKVVEKVAVIVSRVITEISLCVDNS